jgi:hypothetical protein
MSTGLSEGGKPQVKLAECPSIHLNDIDITIICHPPSSRSNDPIIADTRAVKSVCIPPPTKFDRKAKKKSRTAHVMANPQCQPIYSMSIEYVHVDWEGVYRSHRKYVQSLIMESDILPESASDFPDTWSVCESIFVIK